MEHGQAMLAPLEWHLLLRNGHMPGPGEAKLSVRLRCKAAKSFLLNQNVKVCFESEMGGF